MTKPFEMDEVLLRIRNLLETKYLHREIATENVVLEQRVRERTAELDDAHLARAAGMDDEKVELVRRAAPLQDLGKIGIPDSTPRKPGALTAEEWEILKTHTTAGARILGGGRSRVIRLSEEIALSHHERWDGTGYPEARAGDAIPLAARIRRSRPRG